MRLGMRAYCAHAEKRVALVGGNAAYRGKGAQLANPVNDTRAIAAKLKITGFDMHSAREHDETRKWSVPSLCSVRN